MQKALFCLTLQLLIPPGDALCPHLNINFKTSDCCTNFPSGFDLTSNIDEYALDFPILVDNDFTGTRLQRIIIVDGGRLVFSPEVDKAAISIQELIINPGGSLEIGSEDCPFEGNAEIILTGQREDNGEDAEGVKVISVREGAKLEIHGKPKLSWTKLTKTTERKQRGPTEIHLADDVDTWKEGDSIVLASTDFDMEQAEVVTVNSCNGKICTVCQGLKWFHFGETEEGMSMQGEVGLLSRNVVIRGEMESTCYGGQNCAAYNFDTFGGQIIANDGFSTFKIEHAELRHMGSLGIDGRYPIHWSMANQLADGTSYVSNNSIHESFQRCVVCHGTFGCRIQDNVAYESLGHCYFLKDGVEKNAVLTGNLGINTRKGYILPSDDNPSTFFITHPATTTEGNTAAGSQGMGFLFLQAELPAGYSGQQQDSGYMHFYDQNETFRTPLTSFQSNTAHSSPFGFLFDGVLDDNHNVSGSSRFDPREVPTDINSTMVWSDFKDLTCYKATKTCIWMNVPRGMYSSTKVADSGEGMFVQKESKIRDGIFIGQSNKNFGGRNAYIDDNFWYRSLPEGRKYFGFKSYTYPKLLENSVFKGFRKYSMGNSSVYFHAIGVKGYDQKTFFTGVKNVTFIKSHLCFQSASMDPHFQIGDVILEKQFAYMDWDGSLTNKNVTQTLVSTHAHLQSPDCTAYTEMLSACPDKFVSFEYLVPLDSPQNLLLNILSSNISSFVPEECDEYCHKYFLLNTYNSYLISFEEDFPVNKFDKDPTLEFKLAGIDQNVTLTFGICLPMGSTFYLIGNYPVCSMDSLRNDASGLAYYHDHEAGVVFFQIAGDYQREEGEYTRCGQDGSSCLLKTLHFVSVGEDSSADCRGREAAIKKYQISPVGYTREGRVNYEEEDEYDLMAYFAE